VKIRLLVLTEFTKVTDGRSDGRTPHDGIGRACTASRGKKDIAYELSICRRCLGERSLMSSRIRLSTVCRL